MTVFNVVLVNYIYVCVCVCVCMLSLNYEVYVNGDSVGSCRCVLCVVCYVPVEAGGRRQ